MSTVSSRRWRWAVPATALVLVAGGFATRPLLASADTSGLPTVTADQLVAKVAAASPQPLSGTVVYTADLGLPDISQLTALTGSAGASAQPVNLLSGSSTLRVWTDGQTRSRVSLLGTTSEYSVVRNGDQAWTYSSADRAVTHYVLSGATTATAVPGDLPTPTAAADQALAQVRQYSTVSLDARTSVAGRAAYQLVVTPTSQSTLVSRIVIAVDGATDTPLRVQVWSRQDVSAPALELGFTDVRFATPSASTLAWSTPSGATVKDVTVPVPSRSAATTSRQQAQTAAQHVSVTGSGWDSVVTLTGLPVAALAGGDASALASALPSQLPTSLAQLGQDRSKAVHAATGVDTSQLFDALTTKVDGGRLLSSRLVSVLVLDDGRVLAGAVPASTLTALAKAA